MDVYKLQKVNELAKELISQGIATNSEDATKMAEKMIEQNRDNEERPLSDIQDGMTPTTQTSEEESQDTDLRKLQNQVNSNSQSISQIHDKLNEIIGEFNRLEGEINLLKNAARSEKQSTLQKDNSPNTKQNNEDKPKQEEGNNPRSGEFKSNDVAIDKMFYFGK